MNTTCLYHADCIDGLTAAWVVKYKYPKTICIPVKYSEDPPWEQLQDTDLLYTVDFSYPPDILDKLTDIVKAIHVIDHHETAIRKLDRYDNTAVKLTLNKLYSGAELTWHVLFPDIDIPYWISLVGDRDLWRFRYAETNWLYAYITDAGLSFDVLDHIYESLDLTAILQIGKGYWDRRTAKWEKRIKDCAYKMEFCGYTVPCINMYRGEDVSDVLHIMNEDVPFAIAWYEDGKNRYYSLRSRQLNVAALVEPLGGGGHAHAAGLVVGKI